MTAHEAASHPFLQESNPENMRELLQDVKKNYNARQSVTAAIDAVKAINKLWEEQGSSMEASNKEDKV